MKKTILFFIIFLFFVVTRTHASLPELQYANGQGQHITDDDLKEIAIENGILPKDSDEAFFKGEMEKKNTITAWIIIDHKSKLSIIDNLRDMFKNDGTVIRLSSKYYVTEINGVIYNSILKGDINSATKRGVGNIFKTIAIMEGDYDNGKDKVALAKEHLGEEIFQEYMKIYPEKYKKLLEK